MRWGLVLCVVALAGCEAVVVRCPASSYCQNGDIETCQVKCDRDGNHCDKVLGHIDCPSTCTEGENGPACVDSGATCDSAVDTPHCNADSIVMCINNRVSMSACVTGKTCFMDQSNMPICVDKPVTACDTANYPVCVDSITVQQCIPGTNGNALLTASCTTQCTGGYCN